MTRDPMSVLFSGDIFVAQTHGGVSRYFSELYRGLIAHGIRSRIAAPLHWNAYLRALNGNRWLTSPWAPRSRPTLRAADLLANAAARGLLRSHWRHAIYHPTYYLAPPPPSGTRTVVTVYDMIHELFPSMFVDPARVSRAKRWWCERADLIIVISETTRADLLKQFSVDPAKIVVTPLGVQTVGPAPSRAFGRPFFLYVGNRRGYKNFDIILEAFKRYSGELETPVIIAFGGPAFDPKEQRAIAALRLKDRVHWHSGDDSALAAHYRDATALLYPSRYEGFGLPVLEAMAAGCPVVASDTAALREIGGEAPLFFDPDAPEDLLSAMARIEADIGLRARCTAAGLKRAEPFKWRCTTETTIAAYQCLSAG